MRQASSTISRISTSSIASSRTTTQLYLWSERFGMRNLWGSESIRAWRYSLGNANPMRVSSRENAM